tara:strand:+ start:1099 stop:3285 length:2187 start_codon:yes stop_codon:yes gene_type:complete
VKYKVQKNNIAIVFPFAILLIFLRIDLIFLDTTPTGGDMGAHIVPTKYFVEELFYNFKISGWSNDWFAGYPAYYFYFPLPPSIVAILNFVLPFNISYKIMVLISLVLLVISIEKLINHNIGTFSYIGFSGGLLFLLTESFTIYGGNLASSLAGQYSFTYSLAFANFAIYYIRISSQKYSVIKSATFLGLSLLSHIIPFLVYAPIFLFYFLFSKSIYTEKAVGFFIFLFLTLRFSVSLFLNLEFTTNMTYSPYTEIKDLIKPDILPFVIGIVVYVLFASRKNLKQIISTTEMYLIFSSTLLFFYGPEGALWNGRLVPFFNLGLIIIFFKIIEDRSDLLIRKLHGKLLIISFYLICSSFFLFSYIQKWQESYIVTVYFVAFLILVLSIFSFNKPKFGLGVTLIALVISSVNFLPHWLNWNFTGYEKKNDWSDITNLYSGLNELEPGRIIWEPNSDLNKYGTPMVLMTIPMFTNHQSVEGLYFDSSITTPFHFVTVSGLAESPSNPVGGLSYINGDFDRGVEYMKELGVDYFISYTESITDKAVMSNELEYVFHSSPFTVFKLYSDKVQVVNTEVTDFTQPELFDRISNSIFKQEKTESFFNLAMKEFKLDNKTRIVEGIGSDELKILNKITFKGSDINNISISNNRISFQTEHPNELHIIKVSYFPNWKIENGSGPYRISPSFMGVIPYSNNVNITFKNTVLEKVLTIISLFVLLFSVYLFIFRIKKYAE